MRRMEKALEIEKDVCPVISLFNVIVNNKLVAMH